MPKSHIHIVVGMFSVRAARRVLDVSKDKKLVPVFVSVVEGVGVEVGGQIA